MPQGARDGLGFEEVQAGPIGSQANLQPQSPFFVGSVTATDQISGTNLYAQTDIEAGASISGTDLNIGDTISGLNVRAAGSVTDADGRLRSSTIGSPGAFGVIIQAGSFLTAGSIANVDFRQNFAAANDYFFQAWPRSGLEILDATAAGSWNAVTSGTANSGRHTSGVNIQGGGGAVLYDYLAIGEAA